MLKVDFVCFKTIDFFYCNNSNSLILKANLECAVQLIQGSCVCTNGGDCVLHTNRSIYSQFLLLRADLIDH